MRIGELADRAGVPTRTLRFYEQCGILPAPPRTPAGYRFYDETALVRLRFVRAAQALGLSLAEIAEVLRIRDHAGPPCEQVTELLTTHLRALEEQIRELSALRDELRGRLARQDRPDTDRCVSHPVCYLIEEQADGGR
jgi:MerR family transcriptional regulator, copper efflux regulator